MEITDHASGPPPGAGMETMENLEGSVRRLLDERKRLAMENERLLERARGAESELDETRGAAETLRADIERFEADNNRLKDFDLRKNDIRDHLRSIIEKIDRYVESDHTMDTYTNA